MSGLMKRLRMDHGTETVVTDDFTLVVTYWRTVLTNGVIERPMPLPPPYPWWIQGVDA